ncbi:MAG: hypothetical protein SP1CHLAM54_01050 [Chlamydiia bacterium]|nr:hypothetical protein [Chlamydiia bacterium]
MRLAEKELCSLCFSGHIIAQEVAIAYNDVSAKALVKPLYTKLRAALLVYQFCRLKMPMPDVIFPESHLLSKEVSKLLNVPIRRFGPFRSRHILIVTDTVDDTWRYHPLHRRTPASVRVLAFLDERVT